MKTCTFPRFLEEHDDVAERIRRKVQRNLTGTGENGTSEDGEHQAEKQLLKGKTAVIVDSLQSWIRGGGDAQAGGGEPDQVQARSSMEERNKGMLRMCLSLAKRHGCGVREVRDRFIEFNEYDPRCTGCISYAQFLDLLRRRAQIAEDQPIPPHLLGTLTPNKAGDAVGFEEFLGWSVSVSWTEEMQVTCPKEKEIRKIAREHDMMLLDVENFKRQFDHFDTDGSGEIEETEFRNMIYNLWNVKDIWDLPISRLKRFWNELDTDGSGSVSFPEFLVWYRTTQGKAGLQGSDSRGRLRPSGAPAAGAG